MYFKKISKIIIGSNNKGKLVEIRDLLSKSVKIITPYELNLKSPTENGKTFKRNSFIKAKYFSDKACEICLADDSGLEIDFLKRKPGIYSSRWAGKKQNFNLAIRKVFRFLKKKDLNWKKKKITARFICCLTLYKKGYKKISSEGIVEGVISSKRRGTNGFGYDPIFIPNGYKKTFGEMKPSLKYKIDHRYRAFKKIKKFF